MWSIALSDNTKRVLLTGATGFIGHHLTDQLVEDGRYELKIVSRQFDVHFHKDIETVYVDVIGPDTQWGDIVQDVDVVVHAAARAHVMHDTSRNPLLEFRQVNVEGTLNLARQAFRSGVKRFVYLSSIGVNGNTSTQPFSELDVPKPIGPYAISKLEAEQALQLLSEMSSMEMVIIRPPLVYGPNPPGNFRRLLHWLNSGIPLPFGAINNKRSLVALDNLVDFIITCIEHPAAANEVFLISDGEDLSTTELLRRTAIALDKPARLLPVPQSLLELILKMLGKRGLAQQLCGSLQVDISKARKMLGWTPPVSVDEGLRKTAKAFLRFAHK